MLSVSLIVSLLVTSAIAKSQCDRKAFKEGGVEPSDGKGWLRKTVLSFTLGKWHFWDAVRVMSLCILVALNIPICHEYIYISPIILYAVHGLFFETLYSTG